MSLKKSFRTNLENLEIEPGERILIGVSGGLDSIVLLHLALDVELKPVVAHANYHLRGNESDEDEIFVKQTCEGLNVPFHSKSFEVDNVRGNLQAEARKLRYSWFASLLDETDSRYIFTAHHLDDRLETFFINFMRGTGLKGLKSIPERNVRVIRPLLRFRKFQLKKYALEKALNWREDSSNFKDVYQRNRVRHELIPSLENIEPQAVDLAGRSLEFLAEADTFFNRAASRFISRLETDGFVSIIYDSDWDYLFAHPPMHKYVFDFLGFDMGQLDVLSELRQSSSGKYVVGKRFTAFRAREKFILKQTQSIPKSSIEIQKSEIGSISSPIALTWRLERSPDSLRLKKSQARFPLDKLEFPLVLRKWNVGDRFVPFGMKGSKKISDFLIDEKVPRPEKDDVFVLESGGEICWVVGLRTDDRFRIEQADTQSLYFEIA